MYCCLQDLEHLKDTLVGEEDARHPLMDGEHAHQLPLTSELLQLHWINLPYPRASISTSKCNKNEDAVESSLVNLDPRALSIISGKSPGIKIVLLYDVCSTTG